METLTALFRSQHELEQAAAALREQGAINLKTAPATEDQSPSAQQWSNAASSGVVDSTVIGANQQRYLQVVVESSRRRQAEDTIVRYGGQW
ncbi:hypothetical protein [Paenibacillus sp. YYML68]|uniref:hypothetical protein n=1 Tax=Paenibacillus sp. YYML68 TaxID=2909250 RepID=UPI002492409F|nr:hypothetical protein [Paenibacillus sp. YYML68]